MIERALERIAPEALLTAPAQIARAELRRDVVDRYADAMREGATFPPVVAFTDGARYWLADGRHRLEAHQAARPGEPIAVDLREGGELAAVRFALAANVEHGLARSSDDLQRAFRAAVGRQLVDPADAAAVQAVLRCSRAAAYRLTSEHRARARRQRDEQLQTMHRDGRSQREIAGELGVSERTVRRAQTGQKSPETFVRSPTAPGDRPPPRAADPAPPPPRRNAPPPRSPRLPPPAAAPATRDERRAAGVAKIDVAVSYVYELAGFDLPAAVAVLDDPQRRKLLHDLERCQRILANLTDDLGGGSPR